MKYKIETYKSKISVELYTFTTNWLWYVSITTEKKSDNLSVDVIYSRFRIVYTCRIQSVSTVNRSRQMCLCVTVFSVLVQLLVCMSVCLRDYLFV